MQKAVRPYCCFWRLPVARKPAWCACQALLWGVMVSGCGGGGDSSPPIASAPAMAATVQKSLSSPSRMPVQRPTVKIEKTAPSAATANKSTVVSKEESARLAQFRALPLLSTLSDREKVGLLKQLPSASPSDRLTLINGYSELAVLPDRQKDVLLNQIEKISPINIPANLLICACSHHIQLKSCVKERCSNRSELQSICNRACGTLASFQSQCQTARQCAEK